MSSCALQFCSLGYGLFMGVGYMRRIFRAAPSIAFFIRGSDEFLTYWNADRLVLSIARCPGWVDEGATGTEFVFICGRASNRAGLGRCRASIYG